MSTPANFECGGINQLDFEACKATEVDPPQTVGSNRCYKACGACAFKLLEKKDGEIDNLGTDFLSQLPTRLQMDEKIKSIDFDQLKEGESYSYIQGDVVGLKLANDKINQTAGDLAIKSAAKALSGREGEYPARTGGDEFGVLVKHEIEDGRRGEDRKELERGFITAVRMVSNFTQDPDVIKINGQLPKRFWQRKPKKQLGLRMGITTVQPGDDFEKLNDRSSPKPNPMITTEKVKVNHILQLKKKLMGIIERH